MDFLPEYLFVSEALFSQMDSFLTAGVSLLRKKLNSSIGNGNTMVEFFSAAMLFNVCRYLNCMADDDSLRISAASFSALDDLCSPSAAMTFIYLLLLLLLNTRIRLRIRSFKEILTVYFSFGLSGCFRFCCHGPL